MKVSILTDEISQDPETAIELASEWGIRHVEIRCLFGKRVPDDDPDVRRQLEQLLDSYDVDVVAITPGLFKVPLAERESIRRHLDVRLPRSIDFARTMGVHVMIAFTPVLVREARPEDVDFFKAVLARAVDRAEREDVTIALENEPICLSATGSAMAEFVGEMNDEALRVNWDPGNAYYAGEDALEGYRRIRGLVAHVHLKDCVTDRSTGVKRYVPIGQGEVGLEEQIRLLKEDQYSGFVTIETHFVPKVKGTKQCLEGLKAILARSGDSPG